MKPVTMKIKTEILQGVFIVTFNGARLDASFAKDFFTAMKGFIQKGHVDILLDLSAVEFVDSTGLGSIVRCLKEIGPQGQLVLCGVNEAVISLLKMTRLDEIFIQAENRSQALNNLSWEKKNQTAAEATAEPETQAEEVDEGEDWAILLEMEDGEAEEVETGERRKFRRINHRQIVDDDLFAECTNTTKKKHSTALILNISPGGLLLVSSSQHSVGDEIIIKGAVGKSFQLQESTVVRSCRDGHYGLEFTNPSENTRAFLHQLTGAVGLNNMEKFRR